ncbi:MAG: FHA domain-containing protein [Verrucomicrobiota bacterium]
MKIVNHQLLSKIQLLAHPQGEFNIKAFGPRARGNIILRNGRIKQAECGNLRSEQAIKKLIFSPDLKITTTDLTNATICYVDEMDEAPDELIIPLILTANEKSQDEEPESKRSHGAGKLHKYLVYFDVIQNGKLTARVHLKQGRTLIGRISNCPIYLNDTSVSKRHAFVTLTDSFIRITDLQTTNGTYVNGKLVDESELRAQDEVSIGDTLLKLGLQLNNLQNSRKSLKLRSNIQIGKKSDSLDDTRKIQPLHFECYSERKSTIRVSEGFTSIFN